MTGPEIFSYKHFKLAAVAILVACVGCGVPHHEAQTSDSPPSAGPAPAIPPLSANDVSLLFPAPTSAGDFAKLIAVGNLSTPNPQDPSRQDPAWPDAAFQQFLSIAASPAAQVAGTQAQIGLPSEAQSKAAWFIAGIRIDAGAPGLSNDIRAQFGQLPQIRLIVQPVIHNADGTPKVLDIAGHLIFNFTLAKPSDPAAADCLPRLQPDLDAFGSIVADLAAIRTKLSNGQLGTNKITTSGALLGVHPGLADPTTVNNLSLEIKSFLQKHISGSRLAAMAIAGLPSGRPAPWIFVSMVGVPPGVVPALPNGGFVPVHGPTLDGQQFAQMLEPVGTAPRVVPAPNTNNLNPITCKNAAVSAASLPIPKRSGVSTTELFLSPSPSADKTREILDVIADPTKSHFFNTDCISCHTETRRAMDLLKVTNIPGVNQTALPNGQWNIRNFGWSPSTKGVQATVTRRTAAETAAVVTFINSELLAKRQ